MKNDLQHRILIPDLRLLLVFAQRRTVFKRETLHIILSNVWLFRKMGEANQDMASNCKIDKSSGLSLVKLKRDSGKTGMDKESLAANVAKCLSPSSSDLSNSTGSNMSSIDNVKK